MCSLQPFFFFSLAWLLLLCLCRALFFPPLLKCSSFTPASRRKWIHTRYLVRQAHFFTTASARWRCVRIIPFTAVISVCNRPCQLIPAGLWHSRKDVKLNNRQSRKLYPKRLLKPPNAGKQKRCPWSSASLHVHGSKCAILIDACFEAGW